MKSKHVDPQTCTYTDWEKRSSYKNEGDSKAIICTDHKLLGMISVNSTCIQEGCQIVPYSNNEGAKKALYCATQPWIAWYD